MTTPYAPPPKTPPARLAANVVGRRRALVSLVFIWAFIICVFAVFFLVFQQHSDPVSRASNASAFTSAFLPLAIPPVTMAVIGLWLLRLRSRLPAPFRTGQLRLDPAASAPVPAGEESPRLEPIEIRGQSESGQKVTLRLDNAGLYWTAEKSVLQPDRWLETGWEEIKTFAVGAAPARGRVLGLWLLVIAVFVVYFQLFQPSAAPQSLLGVLPWVLPLVIVGVIVMVVSKTRGSVSFATDTHRIVVRSADLDAPLRERLRLAAQTKRPDLFSSNVRVIGLGEAFVRPYAQLGVGLGSDETVRERLRTPAGRKSLLMDDRSVSLLTENSPGTPEETATASVLQVRMWALWQFGWLAAVPLSAAVTGLMTGSLWRAVIWYVVSWFVGLMLLGRLNRWMTRFSGVTLREPGARHASQASTA